MRKKPQSQLLICTEHDMQQPLYWFAEPPPALYLPFCLYSTASYLVDTERDRPKDTGGRRERRRGPPFKREDKKKKQQRVVRLASTQNFEDEGEDNVDWEEAPVAGFFPYSFDKASFLIHTPETLVSGVPSVLRRVVPIPLHVSSREGKREGELTALICTK
ncbi:hypothetical protein RchiOBHm_Chr2g0127981 [Rosa chinensis]|uniref:Uncharacterized protein n=1 Tax=Rosa chinensis TaxID=74649 RepID=A0A2P6RU65_ROSCH|nr:uncharacterized protein LOC112185663 [Rosa chinensis]PRQ49980.1 hypothetical protein RchiOBHm_Chr2g0127981 [Rosa chinensis]